MAFQSTHPLRGATWWPPRWTSWKEISIHAPLAGCDCDYPQAQGGGVIFQSTHPLRGATRLRVVCDGGRCISIHAPLAGCDHIAAHGHLAAILISIHAPLAGCDTVRQNHYQRTF